MEEEDRLESADALRVFGESGGFFENTESTADGSKNANGTAGGDVESDREGFVASRRFAARAPGAVPISQSVRPARIVARSVRDEPEKKQAAPKRKLAKPFGAAEKFTYWSREFVGTYAFLTLAMFSTTQTVLADYGTLGVVTAHAVALAAVVLSTGAACNPSIVLSRKLYAWFGEDRVERCGWLMTAGLVSGQFVAGILAGITVQFVCQTDVSKAIPDLYSMTGVQAGQTRDQAGLGVAQAIMMMLTASSAHVALSMVKVPHHLEFVLSLVLGSALFACEGATVAYLGAGCLNPAYHLGAGLCGMDQFQWRSTSYVYYIFFPVASVVGGLFAYMLSIDYARLYDEERSSFVTAVSKT